METCEKDFWGEHKERVTDFISKLAMEPKANLMGALTTMAIILVNRTVDDPPKDGELLVQALGVIQGILETYDSESEIFHLLEETIGGVH